MPPAKLADLKSYLETSRITVAADLAVLQAELNVNGMSKALRPPSGGDYKLKQKPGDDWFGSDEAKQLAYIVLSYQTPSSGWSKHLGFTRGPRLSRGGRREDRLVCADRCAHATTGGCAGDGTRRPQWPGKRQVVEVSHDFSRAVAGTHVLHRWWFDVV